MGGMAVALDTTAGERERQSLEPLLMTPARPRSRSRSASGSPWRRSPLLVVCSRWRGFYLTLAFAPLPPVGVPFLFGEREVGRFLVVLLPVVLMPALLLYVAAAAERQGSAGQHVVLMFVVGFAGGRLFLQRREPPWLAVPVVGQYALLTLALRGEALPWRVGCRTSALAIALVSLAGVRQLLSRESILCGS